MIQFGGTVRPVRQILIFLVYQRSGHHSLPLGLRSRVGVGVVEAFAGNTYSSWQIQACPSRDQACTTIDFRMPELVPRFSSRLKFTIATSSRRPRTAISETRNDCKGSLNSNCCQSSRDLGSLGALELRSSKSSPTSRSNAATSCF